MHYAACLETFKSKSPSQNLTLCYQCRIVNYVKCSYASCRNLLIKGILCSMLSITLCCRYLFTIYASLVNYFIIFCTFTLNVRRTLIELQNDAV